MKKKLFLFVLLSVFITLINLGTQIRGTQTLYTIVNFGLNQPVVSKPAQGNLQLDILKNFNINNRI